MNTQDLLYLGNCGHSLQEPQSFTLLTYGEIVAAISFLLAFIQFLRPIHRFRIQTRIKYGSIPFYLLFFLSISLIFTAKAPSLFYRITLPYSPYFECIAAITIPIAMGWMLWAALKPLKFKNTNRKRYFDGCAKILVSGNPSDLGELANEISFSSKEIVSACKNYTANPVEEIAKAEKKESIPTYTAYALNVLNLLSDTLFCKKVVSNAPTLAVILVKEIQKQDLYEFGGSAFIRQIIKQSILNEDSILYRETDYEGLGHYKLFTNAFFKNYAFLESKFRPMDAWEYWRDENITLWKVKKYGELLKIIFETYFETKEFNNTSSSINRGLDILTSIARIEVNKLENYTKSTLSNSESWKILNEIASTFKGLLELAIEKSDLLLFHHYLFDNKNPENPWDVSIYKSLARGCYTFFAALASTTKFDEEIRFASIDPWLALYPIITKHKEIKPGYKEIQRRFEAHVFQKLQENLEHGLYPSITRPILTIFHLDPELERSNKEWDKFQKQFFKYFKKNFKAAVKRFNTKALDLLPAHMKYDKKRNCIVQHHNIGRTQKTLELKLDG